MVDVVKVVSSIKLSPGKCENMGPVPPDHFTITILVNLCESI